MAPTTSPGSAHARLGAPVLLAAGALALAACSTSTAGTGSAGAGGSSAASSVTGSAASSAGGTATPSSSASSAPPRDAAGLVTALLGGLQNTRSLRLTLTSTAAGVSVTAHGAETLSQGRLQSLSLTETIGQVGQLQLVLIDGTTYVKLPAGLGTGTTKPWTKVTATSSNPTVATLGRTLDQTLGQASLQSTAEFARAATNVTYDGMSTVDGAPAAHYSLVVDVQKLAAADTTLGAELRQTGLGSIPVDLYTDQKGRPVRIVENFTVQGQKVTSDVEVSDYDQPVTIAAPPADQVGTS